MPTGASTFAVRETASLGQQMLKEPLGINGLNTFFQDDARYFNVRYFYAQIFRAVNRNMSYFKV